MQTPRQPPCAIAQLLSDQVTPLELKSGTMCPDWCGSVGWAPSFLQGEGLPVRSLVGAPAWVAGSVLGPGIRSPVRAHTGGNQSMLFSHVSVSLPSSLPLSLKSNEKMSLGRIKKKKKLPYAVHTVRKQKERKEGKKESNQPTVSQELSARWNRYAATIMLLSASQRDRESPEASPPQAGPAALGDPGQARRSQQPSAKPRRQGRIGRPPSSHGPSAGLGRLP